MSQRVILNVGGTRFETCAANLEADPSSTLARIVRKGSAFKPYEVDNIYTYSLDRDAKHFRVILIFLRNPNGDHVLPVSRFHLRECDFYELELLALSSGNV